jgi:lycopene beta-cyclase
MVENLQKTGKPTIAETWWQKRFLLYASIFLNVLEQKRYLAATIFDRLYSKNPPSLVFRFLDGETNFIEELRIMWSTPKSKFMAAFFDVIRRKYLR